MLGTWKSNNQTVVVKEDEIIIDGQRFVLNKNDTGKYFTMLGINHYVFVDGSGKLMFSMLSPSFVCQPDESLDGEWTCNGNNIIITGSKLIYGNKEYTIQSGNVYNQNLELMFKVKKEGSSLIKSSLIKKDNVSYFTYTKITYHLNDILGIWNCGDDYFSIIPSLIGFNVVDGKTTTFDCTLANDGVIKNQNNILGKVKSFKKGKLVLEWMSKEFNLERTKVSMSDLIGTWNYIADKSSAPHPGDITLTFTDKTAGYKNYLTYPFFVNDENGTYLFGPVCSPTKGVLALKNNILTIKYGQTTEVWQKAEPKTEQKSEFRPIVDAMLKVINSDKVGVRVKQDEINIHDIPNSNIDPILIIKLVPNLNFYAEGQLIKLNAKERDELAKAVDKLKLEGKWLERLTQSLLKYAQE